MPFHLSRPENRPLASPRKGLPQRRVQGPDTRPGRMWLEAPRSRQLAPKFRWRLWLFSLLRFRPTFRSAAARGVGWYLPARRLEEQVGLTSREAGCSPTVFRRGLLRGRQVGPGRAPHWNPLVEWRRRRRWLSLPAPRNLRVGAARRRIPPRPRRELRVQLHARLLALPWRREFARTSSPRSRLRQRVKVPIRSAAVVRVQTRQPVRAAGRRTPAAFHPRGTQCFPFAEKMHWEALRLRARL